MTTLGQRIAALRKDLGLSQEGLGELVGVSRQAVCKWEADGAVPDTEKLLALAKLAGVSAEAFLHGPPEDPAPTDDPADAPADGPAEAVLRRKKRARFWHTVSALIFLALAVDLVVVNFTLQRVARQSAALEAQLATLEQKLEQQADRLDPTAPLVADFTYQLFNVTAPQGNVVQVTFDLIPTRITEGLTMRFAVTNVSGETVSVPGEPGESGHYTGTLEVNGLPRAFAPATLSAVFADGTGTEYPVPLVRIETYSGHGWTWETLWKE